MRTSGLLCWSNGWVGQWPRTRGCASSWSLTVSLMLTTVKSYHWCQHWSVWLELTRLHSPDPWMSVVRESLTFCLMMPPKTIVSLRSSDVTPYFSEWTEFQNRTWLDHWAKVPLYKGSDPSHPGSLVSKSPVFFQTLALQRAEKEETQRYARGKT